ncbi:endonuclease/exonuclease/phosphatase domain-containing protein [Neospora caninum Liverpool]|uniref:Endonuclease/exonuclease/phosphatase domain-containing protein n=1 Tax=Neospora caninum (strain Liverpool) TaxID=572307 RepID=F0VJ78_NEOCL|nr:endonuclease/exonuclease/phosphatase domain-containing protein [Neospora caninum Liverpool]CBZ53789.1 endonuclease/exonuclease/phosphatase domain-containing protein [Neospora caninum Liverpool]|eukprot:XP_003883821.1 endonuclease/exonuclease/phosphatase domain-containing protein [Neospora caninum Liverpool]
MSSLVLCKGKDFHFVRRHLEDPERGRNPPTAPAVRVVAIPLRALTLGHTEEEPKCPEQDPSPSFVANVSATTRLPRGDSPLLFDSDTAGSGSALPSSSASSPFSPSEFPSSPPVFPEELSRFVLALSPPHPAARRASLLGPPDASSDAFSFASEPPSLLAVPCSGIERTTRPSIPAIRAPSPCRAPVSQCPLSSPPSPPSSTPAQIPSTPAASVPVLSPLAASPAPRLCFSASAVHAAASSPKAPVDASRDALFYPSYTRRGSTSTASLGPSSRLNSVVGTDPPAMDFNSPVDSINIVSFNAGLLEYRLCGIQVYQNPPFTRRRLSHIPISLLDTNSDIICLQEVYDDIHADFLVDSMRHVFPYVGRRTSGGRFALHNGLMVLSRFPIRHTRFHPFHDVTNIERLFGSKGMLECGIDIPGVGVVAVFNIHLASGAVDPESPYVEALRSAEIQQVLSACEDAGIRGEVPLVVGDLNAAPDLCASNYKSFVERGWRDCWLQVHGNRDLLLRHHLVHQQQMLLQHDLHPDLLEERQRQVRLELEHLLQQHKIQQRMLADDVRGPHARATHRPGNRGERQAETQHPASNAQTQRSRSLGTALGQTTDAAGRDGSNGVRTHLYEETEMRAMPQGDERGLEGTVQPLGFSSAAGHAGRERSISGGERARKFLEAELRDGYHPLPPNGDSGARDFPVGDSKGETREALLRSGRSGAFPAHVAVEMGAFPGCSSPFDVNSGEAPLTPQTAHTASTAAPSTRPLTEAGERDAQKPSNRKASLRDLETGDGGHADEEGEGNQATGDAGSNGLTAADPPQRLLAEALITTQQVELNVRHARRSAGWESLGRGGSAIGAEDSEATTTDDAEEWLLRRKSGERTTRPGSGPVPRCAYRASSLLSTASLGRVTTQGRDDEEDEDWTPREDFTWDPQNPLNSIGPHAGCHGLRCDYVFLPPQRLSGALRDFVPVSGEILLREPRVMVDACCFGCLGQVMLVTLSDHYALKISLRRSCVDVTLSQSPSMVIALKEANLFCGLPGAVFTDEEEGEEDLEERSVEDEGERAVKGAGAAAQAEGSKGGRNDTSADAAGEARCHAHCLLTDEGERGQ